MVGKAGKRLIGPAVCLLLLLSGAVIYAVHREIPFMMDDLWYATRLAAEEPVENLRDIVEAQIWHYNNWGGRSMTHGLLQMILLTGERAADICNVLVTFLLAAVICLAGGCLRGIQPGGAPGPMGAGDCPKKEWSGGACALFACTAMLLGLNANWKMSMFWQAGAANYLYITVFIFLYLHCYLRELPGESGGAAQGALRRLPGITVWILPLGLLAGWSNENMGPAVCLVSAAVTAWLWRKGRRPSVWMILGCLASFAGSAFVVLAPGNFVRNEQVPENQYGILWRLFLRGYYESRAALEYLFPVLLLAAAVLVIGVCVLKLPLGRRSMALLCCALLSWGAMILSPHYPDRATFGTMALLVCVILDMGRRSLRERRDLALPFGGTVLLIWLRGMYFLGEYLAIAWGWIR